MRFRIVVVVLLLTLCAAFAFAADPPGGPGWYQLQDDTTLTGTFEGGLLVIAGGTPGLLVGVSAGRLRIQFERGVAASRKGEIKADASAAEKAALTIDVDPSDVRALLRQPRSKATPPAGSGSGGVGISSSSGGGSIVGTGTSRTAVTHHETVAVTDTQEVRIASQPLEVLVPPASEQRRPAGDVFQPPASSSGPGGVPGRPGRVIALEDHEAWLAKVLRLLGEEGARCQTKPYGPGWVSICDPRREIPIAALRQ